MNTKKEILSCALSAVFISGASAEVSSPVQFVLPAGYDGASTSVQTSMHDAGSAAANYTLGSGGSSSVQTTQGYSSGESGGSDAAAYSESKPDRGAATQRSGGRSGSYSSSRRGSGRAASYSSGSRTSRRGGYVASGGGNSAAAGYGGEKDAKGGVVIPQAYDPSPLIITAEAGYQSQYVYNGLNRIRLSAYTPNGGFGVSSDDFDMYYVGANMKWKGFSLGLKYIRSLDSNLNPLFFPTTTYKKAYSEYLFDVNYTLGVIAGPQGEGNWLDATVGYELTYFPEETFWNTDTQHKFYAQLKMNRYKWARPSVAFHSIESGDVLNSGTILPGFDLLSGEQLIFQVDGGDQVYDGGSFKVAVGYYVKYGKGSGYDLPQVFNEDWYQAGISVPISINDLTITPSVHYTDHGTSLVDEPGFWWGINAKYTF